jgi:hypothetical protein
MSGTRAVPPAPSFRTLGLRGQNANRAYLEVEAELTIYGGPP